MMAALRDAAGVGFEYASAVRYEPADDVALLQMARGSAMAVLNQIATLRLSSPEMLSDLAVLEADLREALESGNANAIAEVSRRVSQQIDAVRQESDRRTMEANTPEMRAMRIAQAFAQIDANNKEIEAAYEQVEEFRTEEERRERALLEAAVENARTPEERVAALEALAEHDRVVGQNIVARAEEANNPHAAAVGHTITVNADDNLAQARVIRDTMAQGEYRVASQEAASGRPMHTEGALAGLPVVETPPPARRIPTQLAQATPAAASPEADTDQQEQPQAQETAFVFTGFAVASATPGESQQPLPVRHTPGNQPQVSIV